MALPKLNDAPQYTMQVPSTGKTVKYRPFLVKEQKILLIALESQDDRQILDSVVNTIASCCDMDFSTDTLTTFDIEWMFIQIRSVSVGETSKLMLPCTNCEGRTEHTIKLKDISVDLPAEPGKIIKINDKFSIQMRYPKYGAILMTPEESGQNLADVMYDMIILCMDYLITDDERIKFDEEPRASIESFMDEMEPSQFELMMEFVQNLPSLKHNVDYDCQHCKTPNHLMLEGVKDFF